MSLRSLLHTQRNCTGIALHSKLLVLVDQSDSFRSHPQQIRSTETAPVLQNMVHDVTTWFSKHRETSVTKSRLHKRLDSRV